MDKSALRREQFPVTHSLVYLNHAAVGPLPDVTYRMMERHAREQRDSGALHWRGWLQEYVDFRASAARLIGCSAGEISILKNTSEGVSFVAEGLRWRDGDNVITSTMEFPSNSVPWRRLDRRGVECRFIDSAGGRFGVEEIEPLIDSRTRLVAVSSAYFHNGFAPDLHAIGDLCAARGVLFFVDAIQTLGAVRCDVKRARITFLAADGHKWLLGPEGTALFFCDEGYRDQLEVLETGWMNVNRKGAFLGCSTELLSDGRRFEAGSLNTNGVHGLRASIDLLDSLGAERIEQEVVRLAEYVAERCEAIGFRTAAPRPLRSGIVGVIPPEIDTTTLRSRVGISGPIAREDASVLLHALLEREKIICAPREGMLRISAHFYNDESDIDRLVEVLASVT